MENSESSRELLENVTISDVNNSNYMIQRMSVENSQLLGSELLNHHNGLVVDLGAGDFIPVNYASEDLLGQDLTEEDRNLAAALVAVQLSQQQKQQQLQQDSTVMISTSLPSLVTSNGLDTKVSLSDQQLLISSEKGGLNGSYLQIVESDGIYVDKQGLPKLMDAQFDDQDQEIYDRNKTELKLLKDDDSHDTSSSLHRDSDGENKSDNRTLKKSLPHKKRISRKLKKNVPPNKKNVQKCNLCEQTFNTTEEYAEHQAMCQTTITPVSSSASQAFACQLCTASFGDQLTFFGHLKAHYEPLNQENENNEDNSSEKAEDKQEHIENQGDTLLTSLLSSIHCVQCNKTFKRQKAYETHVREVHGKIELNEFSEPEDLMAGIDVVVDQGGQESDEDTKAWYQREDELNVAEVDLKDFETQEHVCKICKQPFPLRAILVQHLATCRATAKNGQDETETTVTKKKKKQKEELCCTLCERVFTHRNSLIYHMRSHTGNRPHQCDQCGKSFFAASALKVHLRLHSGDKPYKCNDCGRNFRQWGDLKYHCISKHSDEKEYQCEYCGKDFARKYSLIVHRRIHTGEKNYKCEFCSKTFRASSYLQNHRRIHTGEKPHACEVCAKPFRVRSDMKRHLKTHGRKLKAVPCKTNNAQVATDTYTSSHSDLVITKIEEQAENSGGMSEDSNEVDLDHKGEIEASVASLQFDNDPLESRTLYSGGPQLLICYPSDLPVRSEQTTTWIQAD